MQFISTRVHGYIDYAMGAFLIVCPWLFGFAGNQAAMLVPVVLGAGVIAYSLFTDYELGVVRKIPMTGHLMLDALGGAFLAASPWIFQFSETVYLPHLILGLTELAAVATTEHAPARAESHMGM